MTFAYRLGLLEEASFQSLVQAPANAMHSHRPTVHASLLAWPLMAILAAGQFAAGATVLSYTTQPTLDLPGYTTYTFTANSDAGDIVGFNFADAGGSGFGFTGDFYQTNPFEQQIVFGASAAGNFTAAGMSVETDTHFLPVASEGITIHARESGNYLGAAFNYLGASHGSPSLSFARLVVKDDTEVKYRGEFTVRTPQGNVLERVGFPDLPPEPPAPPTPGPLPSPPPTPPLPAPPQPTPPIAEPPHGGLPEVAKANVSVTRRTRSVTPDEIAAGAPAGGFIHDFYVTSATDLLVLSDADVSAPVFQHTLGSDVAAPPSELVAQDPALGADSFIQLPGSTSTLGGGFEFGAGDQAWFDLSNDGAQDDFLLARLTTEATGVFSGLLSVRSETNLVNLPFTLELPSTEHELDVHGHLATHQLELPVAPPPPVETPPSIPPVETPPVEHPGNPPIDEPYLPPAGPIEPPLVTYPPAVGYPIVDPPSGLPIDPVDPPHDPSLPGDSDEPVADVPPVEQPSDPHADPPSEGEEGTVFPILTGEWVYPWPGMVPVELVPGEIDVTLPIVWDTAIFRTDFPVFHHGLVDFITFDGLVEATTMTDGLGQLFFDGDGAATSVAGLRDALSQRGIRFSQATEGVIPEPTSGVLVLAAVLGMIAARRRRLR